MAGYGRVCRGLHRWVVLPMRATQPLGGSILAVSASNSLTKTTADSMGALGAFSIGIGGIVGGGIFATLGIAVDDSRGSLSSPRHHRIADRVFIGAPISDVSRQRRDRHLHRTRIWQRIVWLQHERFAGVHLGSASGRLRGCRWHLCREFLSRGPAALLARRSAFGCHHDNGGHQPARPEPS